MNDEPYEKDTNSDNEVTSGINEIVQEINEKITSNTNVEKKMSEFFSENEIEETPDELDKESSRNDIEIESLSEYQSSIGPSERSSSRNHHWDEGFDIDDPSTCLEEDQKPMAKRLVNVINLMPIDYEKKSRSPEDFYNCPYCPYKATKQDFIFTHIPDTHPSITCYKCQVCEFAHPQLSILIEHINRKHQKIKYQCPDCKAKFSTVWNCEGHILIRHPKKAKKLLHAVFKKKELEGGCRRCPFCGFHSNSPGMLKKHVQQNHTEVIRYKCWYCLYITLDLNGMSEHMKVVHPKESREEDI